MSYGRQKRTRARANVNPANAYTTGDIVKGAGLSTGKFKELLKVATRPSNKRMNLSMRGLLVGKPVSRASITHSRIAGYQQTVSHYIKPSNKKE